jgi:hypothetical protein
VLVLAGRLGNYLGNGHIAPVASRVRLPTLSLSPIGFRASAAESCERSRPKLLWKSAMQDRTTIVHQLVIPDAPRLADRVDAKIGKAEQELEASKSELADAAVAEAQAEKKYTDLRGLTLRIKNLAPLIRDEVSLLERSWRSATEKKLKVKETVDLASKELVSVCRAREQLKQIGLYHPSA